jgi:asparagine synthetase B (glutamine-hydrolysing)
MTAAMRHRGPDDEGFLAGNPRAPGLALGMRRLSIIDLAGGRQPIWNETKDVAVVYNGELYNYPELRERLSLCGHRFATQSDTEILVHAWEEWGEDSLTELRGMFAFARLRFFSSRATRWASSRSITRKHRMDSRSLRRFVRCLRRAPFPNACRKTP